MKRSATPCLRWLVVPALATIASPAAAQATNDARCFIVSNMFAKGGDVKARQAATQASYYYLGRLNGTIPQIEAAIASEGKTINAKNAAGIMRTCAQALAKRAGDIQALGRRLSQSKR